MTIVRINTSVFLKEFFAKNKLIILSIIIQKSRMQMVFVDQFTFKRKCNTLNNMLYFSRRSSAFTG